MGARQSKRSVDITTSPKKGDVDGSQPADGRLEMIEDGDKAAVNGSTRGAEREEQEVLVNGSGSVDHDEEKVAKPEKPQGGAGDEKNDSSIPNESTNAEQNKEPAEKEAEVSKKEQKKEKKDKMKKKWSFRLGMSKKEKKPREETSKNGDVANEEPEEAADKKQDNAEDTSAAVNSEEKAPESQGKRGYKMLQAAAAEHAETSITTTASTTTPTPTEKPAPASDLVTETSASSATVSSEAKPAVSQAAETLTTNEDTEPKTKIISEDKSETITSIPKASASAPGAEVSSPLVAEDLSSKPQSSANDEGTAEPQPAPPATIPPCPVTAVVEPVSVLKEQTIEASEPNVSPTAGDDPNTSSIGPNEPVVLPAELNSPVEVTPQSAFAAPTESASSPVDHVPPCDPCAHAPSAVESSVPVSMEKIAPPTIENICTLASDTTVEAQLASPGTEPSSISLPPPPPVPQAEDSHSGISDILTVPLPEESISVPVALPVGNPENHVTEKTTVPECENNPAPPIPTSTPVVPEPSSNPVPAPALVDLALGDPALIEECEDTKGKHTADVLTAPDHVRTDLEVAAEGAAAATSNCALAPFVPETTTKEATIEPAVLTSPAKEAPAVPELIASSDSIPADDENAAVASDEAEDAVVMPVTAAPIITTSTSDDDTAPAIATPIDDDTLATASNAHADIDAAAAALSDAAAVAADTTATEHTMDQNPSSEPVAATLPNGPEPTDPNALTAPKTEISGVTEVPLDSSAPKSPVEE